MLEPITESQSKILVIDDIDTNVLLLRTILERAGYEVIGCTQPAEALNVYQANQPNLIILDLHMPGISGYGILRALRQRVPDSNDLPILIFTADMTFDARLQSLEAGASDFLTKPGDAAEILLRIRVFLQAHHMYRRLQTFAEVLEKKVTERTLALWQSQLEVLERLSKLGELRGGESGNHAARVGALSAAIAAEMGLSKAEVEVIRLAAPLHDIGKIGIPDNILLKRGSLTEHESHIFRSHTRLGADVLKGGNSALLQCAEAIALTHHERWDGMGFPQGLSMKNIPLPGRIVAVADAYDTLTRDHQFTKALQHPEAIGTILREVGKKFDPEVVEAFLRVIATDFAEKLAS